MTADDRMHGRAPCGFSSLVLAATVVLSAFGPMSCAVVDPAIVGSTEKNIVVASAPRAAKDFPDAAEPKTAPAKVSAAIYPGSAPYICSPSGFGQKSRCFARTSRTD
ncbi:hypothetical protein [Rhizobium sp. GCM10022189]|uniref:hypothetical protein n=1 Tax=Rhizobium sp. GCM10022189 TaxID=3252654 RepID=UPI00360B5BF1